MTQAKIPSFREIEQKQDDMVLSSVKAAKDVMRKYVTSLASVIAFILVFLVTIILGFATGVNVFFAVTALSLPAILIAYVFMLNEQRDLYSYVEFLDLSNEES